MKTKKILSEKVFKAGYVARKEIISTGVKDAPWQEWTMAYNLSGAYIGDMKNAYYLCVKRGIYPELRTPESNVCTIGFSSKDGKWYGWSHRAIYGFKIGSTCEKGNVHYVPRRRGGKGKWVAKTVADAKRMACDFASGVS